MEKAWHLLITFDPETWRIIGISLYISVMSVLITSCIGVPLGIVLSQASFRGKGVLVTLLNTLQALPTVLIGLIVYSLLSRQGIFGHLGWMYSTKAMIFGQSLLILPLIILLSLSAVNRLDSRYRKTAHTLGAGRFLTATMLMREARFALVAALVTAFGRVIAEVGISMMLGGNIKGLTRTMTTAMALEYDKGAFDLALALGIALLALSLVMNLALRILQGSAK